MIELDPESPLPAYLQIRDRIVTLIRNGTLRPGDRLPPTRELAATAGVHRSSVVRAFEETRALGYLESRPGSYTTVRRRARPPAEGRSAGQGTAVIDWQARSHDPVGAVAGTERPREPEATNGGLIDFARLAADPDLAPEEDLRRSVSKTMIGCGAEVLDYAEPAGWRPLRETVARRLRAHGVAVGCEEILITNGAQQALDLVLRLLTRSGDRVVVEAPTYGMFHPLLRLHGVEPVEIPMKRDGMDLDALEKALDGERPKLLYTMPNFHNPTGVTTDQPHRERLLRLCEANRLPIVEDGFEEGCRRLGATLAGR